MRRHRSTYNRVHFDHIRYWLGIAVGKLVSKTKNLRDKNFEIYDHARAYIGSLGFWFGVFVVDWIFLYHVLMPAVNKVDFSMCECRNPMVRYWLIVLFCRVVVVGAIMLIFYSSKLRICL